VFIDDMMGSLLQAGPYCTSSSEKTERLSVRSHVRALAVLIAGYVGFCPVAHYFGFDADDLAGRLLPLLPLVAASVSFVFPTIPSRDRHQ
jgi:hypothetical protein